MARQGRGRRQLVKVTALTSDTIYHVTQEDDRQVVIGQGGVRQLTSASVYERKFRKRRRHLKSGLKRAGPCQIIWRAHYTILPSTEY